MSLGEHSSTHNKEESINFEILENIMNCVHRRENSLGKTFHFPCFHRILKGLHNPETLRAPFQMKTTLMGMAKRVSLTKFWSVFWKLLCDFRMTVVYPIHDSRVRVSLVLTACEEPSKGKWNPYQCRAWLQRLCLSPIHGK